MKQVGNDLKTSKIFWRNNQMITACRSKFMNERQTMISHVMYYTIWYHLYNLKNMKKTHGGVLLLVKPATLLKVTLLHGCFSRFLNCANGTKSRKASHIYILTHTMYK